MVIAKIYASSRPYARVSVNGLGRTIMLEPEKELLSPSIPLADEVKAVHLSTC